jgi:hypothetical protein
MSVTFAGGKSPISGTRAVVAELCEGEPEVESALLIELPLPPGPVALDIDGSTIRIALPPLLNAGVLDAVADLDAPALFAMPDELAERAGSAGCHMVAGTTPPPVVA